MTQQSAEEISEAEGETTCPQIHHVVPFGDPPSLAFLLGHQPPVLDVILERNLFLEFQVFVEVVPEVVGGGDDAA